MMHVFSVFCALSCSRFILHIPSEERDNAIRVCFQIELAHWFYLDFCMQNAPGLPQCGIRDFAKADILKRSVYITLIRKHTFWERLLSFRVFSRFRKEVGKVSSTAERENNPWLMHRLNAQLCLNWLDISADSYKDRTIISGGDSLLCHWKI